MSLPRDRERPFRQSLLVELLPHHTPEDRAVFVVGIGILITGLILLVAVLGARSWFALIVGVFVALIPTAFGLYLALRVFFRESEPLDEAGVRRRNWREGATRGFLLIAVGLLVITFVGRIFFMFLVGITILGAGALIVIVALGERMHRP